MITYGALDFFKKFDALFLNETFQLNSTSLKDFYCFDQLATKENAGRPVGGICVAVKPLLPAKLLFNSKFCVVVDTQAITVLNCYFSPNIDCLAIVEEIAERLCDLNLNKPCLVVGDFNARADIPGSEKFSLLSELLEDFGFSLINERNQYTYISHNGKSVIDLVFANFDGISVKIEDTDDVVLLRKHIPLLISCKLPYIAKEERNLHKGKRRKVRNIDVEKIVRVESMAEQGEVEKAYSELCDGILSAVPENPVRNAKPKYSLEIDTQKWKVYNLHQKIKNSPLLLEEYNNEKMKFKNMVAEFQRRKATKEEEERIRDAELRPWKFNVRKNGTVPCRIPLEEWNNHFQPLYNPPEDPKLPVEITREHDYVTTMAFEINEESLFETDNTDQLNRAFTLDECQKTLMTCSDNKAVGPDSLANEHLKGSFPMVGYLWVLLFNCILMTGEIIQAWRCSVVKVLYKGKGDNKDPNSYRGIALLNHAYKWFTKMIASRISDFTEDKSIPLEQFGFRKGRSTLDAFFKLRSYVTENLKCKTPVYAVFIDFRKAFDMVPRDALLKKLYVLHGIRGRVLRIVASILQYNLIRIFDNISYSEEILQTRGVQQGDSLSPLLFILFTSDLPCILKDAAQILYILLFADDLVLYSTCKISIQNALNELTKYCKKNKLEVNLNKTKVLTFRKNGFSKNVAFYFDGNVVQNCSSYEYLGFTVQPSWTFSKHILRKRAKAAAASFRIKGLQGLSMNAAKKYFCIMIEPIVTYGIDIIWYDLSASQFKILDGCFFDFFKKVLGVPRCTRNRKILLLVDSPLLTESLVSRGRVRPTEAYQEYLNNFENKLADIEEEFFMSPAMKQNNWRHANYEKRH